MKTNNSYFAPFTGLAPKFPGQTLSIGAFTVHARRWATDTFDMATLASHHNLHFPYQLKDVFLSTRGYAGINLEIELSAQSLDQTKEQLSILKAMLYANGIAPTMIPFISTHSINDYAGINSRDSGLTDRLHEGLKRGLTSKDIKVESWLNEANLAFLVCKLPQLINKKIFTQVVSDYEKWEKLEKERPILKIARLAIDTAPFITNISSSMLHLWQGIESLFPSIQQEISFRLSILIACLTSDLAEAAEMHRRVKTNYKFRSLAAHGKIDKITHEHWLEAWKILSLIIKAIIKKNGMPSEESLLEELLN